MTESERDHRNESQVLQQILDCLEPLDSESRNRLLRMATIFYDLASPTSISTQSSTYFKPNDLAKTQKTSRIHFGDRMDISPKEFIREKDPNTDIERVACLAYYLANYRETLKFKTIDISKLNMEAAQPKFSNAAYAMSNAAKKGLIVTAGKGFKQLSSMGEQYIHALPDRANANALISSIKRRKTTKKSRPVTKK